MISFGVPLSKILTAINVVVNNDAGVTGIAIDSRHVKQGDLFCACRGLHSDGRVYVDAAIKQGAVAVLVEKDAQWQQISQRDNALIIPVENLADQLSLLADTFYGSPSTQLTVIGVTGTNGKTTVSQFIAQALDLMQMRCGVIGTLGIGLYGHLTATTHTTPNAIDVQYCLANMLSQHAKAVSMEVSSHGLSQGRVHAVRFHTAVFTNLTRDHLDYHGTMDAYGQAKRLLFSHKELQRAVINQEDDFGRDLAASLRNQVPTYTYSTQENQADIFVKNVNLSGQGICATVLTPWGEGELVSHLLGRFNLSNLLSVITVLCAQGYELNQVLNVVGKLTPAAGRMQRLGGDKQPIIIVDYAHTPDALDNVLATLRGHCDGELWCVLGCGGNRDEGKRPLMLQIAQQYAKHVLVTSDNPRGEKPEKIAADMLAGSINSNDIIIKLDRREAIHYAISHAAECDIILIAGKGHEDYQEIDGARLPFSDAFEAQRALNDRGCHS